MNANILIIIVIATLAAIAVLSGLSLYRRSMRMLNRAHMSTAFTNISHELLTPLTVISASVERLREREPKYGNDYLLMEMNIERMTRLLQEIIETSKSLSGELKLLVSNGDVMQYIKQTALCLEPLMAKRNQSFTIQCTPESMMGWLDTDKLDKIIYNLVSNAAKYTPENGSVALQARTNKTYDYVVIKVIDTGIGIPPEKMKKLFQRFYDGDYRRMRTTGTGLGLALTRDLVDLYGGTIGCESEKDKGTTFTVRLPISKEKFSASQIDEEHKADFEKPKDHILDFANVLPALPEETVADQAVEDCYKILIVEDNMELLMLMRQLLSHKYHTYTALNGEEALEIIRKAELDLVVSDVMMPKMDGNELTRQIKQDPNTSHLPVILLTAKTQEEDRQKSLMIGADDYITKPFKLRDLELRINNIIENRQRIQQDFMQQTARQPQQPETAVTLSPDEEFLKRAIDCVNSHLDDADFDREAFAKEMGASTSTLYNKLRSITGMNVSNFIRNIRMKEAMRIAQENPNIRVSDLAYRVGYSDPKYFSTCFKKDFGMQPKEYLDSIHAQAS